MMAANQAHLACQAQQTGLGLEPFRSPVFVNHPLTWWFLNRILALMTRGREASVSILWAEIAGS
jgi:hypothetical protein